MFVIAAKERVAHHIVDGAVAAKVVARCGLEILVFEPVLVWTARYNAARALTLVILRGEGLHVPNRREMLQVKAHFLNLWLNVGVSLRCVIKATHVDISAHIAYFLNRC